MVIIFRHHYCFSICVSIYSSIDISVLRFILGQHISFGTFGYFIIPGEGGARMTSFGMSGSSRHKDYCLGEWTFVAFSECVNDGERVCVCTHMCVHLCAHLCACACVRTWILSVHFGLFGKSVLIFHPWGFYGTNSIHEKSDGHNLIFQTKY